jgi:signal transduction histidine kinase
LPAIVADIQRDAGEHLNIRLAVPAEATAVRCDVHLFELMLRNLLNNARRYARAQIAVSFSANAAVNRLIVEDDGPGIAESEQARVFDSFVKLDRTDQNEGGFGLGLAIVKRAVEWHDGQVLLARSALGGAKFELSWPTSSR